MKMPNCGTFGKKCRNIVFCTCRTNPEANHKSVARFLSKCGAKMLQIVAFFLTRTIHVLPNTELECASCVCTEYQNLESSRIQYCIQKMWLGGGKLSFQNVHGEAGRGGEGVYDI